MSTGQQDDRPLRNLVADPIRSRIIAGELEPGTRLREEELAAEFKVSRVPVREALQLLEHQGFLILRKYRGAIVAEPALSGISELVAIRAELEAMAARLAAERCGGEYAEALQTIARDGSKIDPVDRPGQIAQLVEQFHELVALASGNQELAELLRTIRSRLSWVFSADLAHRAPASWSDHLRIATAISEGDGAAAELMRSHVIGDAEYLGDLFSRPGHRAHASQMSTPADPTAHDPIE